MNINISNINFNQYKSFASKKHNAGAANPVTFCGEEPIKTAPAQLSIFHMHDFHGQNIRMERVYSAINQYDNGKLVDEGKIFDNKKPVDKLKLCSGDMYLGENLNELKVVNMFLNLAGVTANAVGNHECDTHIDMVSDIVKDRNYHFLGANLHPSNDNKMNSILSKSLIVTSNGNKYGIIGLAPIDMAKHMKRPEETKAFNLSDEQESLKDLQNEVQKLKERGVNKIILLSHLGLKYEQYIAQNVSDIDIILGGHTHDMIKEVEEGKNLFTSPKGEPVLIMQVGRDGEYIGMPNVKFNELGQITAIQYNLVKTDDFGRSLVAKNLFENILGKPEIKGKFSKVEDFPEDMYAQENPHCDYILDSLKSELGTDIAIMNSANIRGKFYEGVVDSRDLRIISPFANKVTVIEATEKELVDAINRMVKASMSASNHRPGILQVSGLKYEYSKSQGKITSLTFIDKQGKEIPVDIENPRADKIYKVAADDYCIMSDKCGMNMAYRLDNALEKYDCDKDYFVGNYLLKQTVPQEIKSDGRIKVCD